MCQILIQHYACGHQKPICITPCPRARGNFPTPNFSRPGTPASPFWRPDSPLYPTSIRSHSSCPRLSPPNPPRWLTLLPSYDPAIQYCPTFFPHNVGRSSWPCLQCYLRPEWVAYRESWVANYRMNHPGPRNENMGVLSGIALIPERLGLVNVLAEVDRISSLRGGKGVGRKGVGNDADSQSGVSDP